jgi:hypothetical protein
MTHLQRRACDERTINAKHATADSRCTRRQPRNVNYMPESKEIASLALRFGMISGEVIAVFSFARPLLFHAMC